MQAIPGRLCLPAVPGNELVSPCSTPAVDGGVGGGRPLPAREAGIHGRGPGHTPAGAAPHPRGPAPSLGVDDDGPRLVAVPAEHHAHGIPIQPVDVDGVGGLARPKQRPAVDVNAEVMRLPVRVLALARRGQNEGLEGGKKRAPAKVTAARAEACARVQSKCQNPNRVWEPLLSNQLLPTHPPESEADPSSSLQERSRPWAPRPGPATSDSTGPGCLKATPPGLAGLRPHVQRDHPAAERSAQDHRPPAQDIFSLLVSLASDFWIKVLKSFFFFFPSLGFFFFFFFNIFIGV